MENDCGPEIRTIPIPPWPAGVEIAAIVEGVITHIPGFVWLYLLSRMKTLLLKIT